MDKKLLEKLINQFNIETEINMLSINLQDKPTLKAFIRWLVIKYKEKDNRVSKLETIINWYSEDSVSSVETLFDNEMEDMEG